MYEYKWINEILILKTKNHYRNQNGLGKWQCDVSNFALGCKLLRAYSTSWSLTSEKDLCKASHPWTYQSFHNIVWWNALAIPNWFIFHVAMFQYSVLWPCYSCNYDFFGNLHITIHFGFYDFHLWLNISCKGHVQLMTYELLNPCHPLVARDNGVISNYES